MPDEELGDVHDFLSGLCRFLNLRFSLELSWCCQKEVGQQDFKMGRVWLFFKLNCQRKIGAMSMLLQECHRHTCVIPPAIWPGKLGGLEDLWTVDTLKNVHHTTPKCKMLLPQLDKFIVGPSRHIFHVAWSMTGHVAVVLACDFLKICFRKDAWIVSTLNNVHHHTMLIRAQPLVQSLPSIFHSDTQKEIS
jgi:hypothetical protein